MPLYAFGVMMMLGFVFAMLLARPRAKRSGIDPQNIVDLALVILITGIAGARLFYVIEFRDSITGTEGGLINMVKIWRGGLVFYGGFIAASLAVLAFCKWKKLSVPVVLDLIAPSLMVGLAFGRIGCFLNGCCYGRPCSMPWAVNFPADSFVHMPPNALPVGVHVHPVQLYSALGALVIYAVLEFLFYRKHRAGAIALMVCVLYAIHRFTVEFFRADTLEPLQETGFLDPDRIHWQGLSTSQTVSIVIVAIALVAWGLYHMTPEKEAKPDTPSRSERRAQSRHKRKGKKGDAMSDDE